jgi:hypothetical protein
MNIPVKYLLFDSFKWVPRDNGYPLGRLFVCCILFLFYIQQIEAQKNKYGFIMGKIQERIYENYDSMMYTYNNYAEYAYIDSSKELLGAVRINSFRKQSGLYIFSRLSNSRDIAQFLLSGTMAGQQQNLGFSNIGEITTGVNAYSAPETDRVFQFCTIALQSDKPENETACFCSIYAKLKKTNTNVEVKDTLYNGIDCFLLKAITQSMFVFDGRPDKHFEDKYLNQKRMTGNWDTCYQRTVVTDIVNKTDYAILLSSHSIVWTNNHNEQRTSLLMTKYRKTGNYYYQEYYEKKSPRIFQGFRGGFNDRDLYTLIVSESSEARIDKYMEQELQISKMKRITSDRKYEDFLKKEPVINPDILKQWDSYWHNRHSFEYDNKTNTTK